MYNTIHSAVHSSQGTQLRAEQPVDFFKMFILDRAIGKVKAVFLAIGAAPSVKRVKIDESPRKEIPPIEGETFGPFLKEESFRKTPFRSSNPAKKPPIRGTETLALKRARSKECCIARWKAIQSWHQFYR